MCSCGFPSLLWYVYLILCVCVCESVLAENCFLNMWDIVGAVYING